MLIARSNERVGDILGGVAPHGATRQEPVSERVEAGFLVG